MPLISYLVRLKAKNESTLNVSRCRIQGTASPPCSSTWGSYAHEQLVQPNWRCLASDQCCHLSTVATCPRSCALVSLDCGCSRCAFWHLHTVPIELPMSSTSDLQSGSGDGWQHVWFLKN